MEEELNYSYDQINSLIVNKINKIKHKNFDIIIAIGSGGLIPGVIIKNLLNIPMYVISVSSYDQKIKGDIKINQWIDNDFTNKHILLVDEIDDTGSTLTFCTNKLKKYNKCNNLSIFVVHNRNSKKCDNYINHKNYYECQIIDSDLWIKYPWK